MSYTRLANALYEELIGADLTKNQSKVAHAICRKTYGYGKKMDRISDSQLAQITRLPRQKVNKAKNELIAMKVILREGQQIGPNKNIEEWQIEGCHYSGDNVTALVTKSVTKTVTALSPKQGHTKETITKEKRNNKNTMSESVRTECEKSPDRHEETDKAFEEIFWCAGMRKAAIESGRFHHDGNPIMTWCIGNV
ncbi:TPA: replication protein, partial [Escherichia coli]